MYPKPDRSNRRPDLEALDIGWGEGRLSDGRPFRVEIWAHDQISYMQCFFSALGLEHLGRSELQQFLERECLVRFRSNKRYAGGRLMTDASGNQMWEVNVVIGDEDDRYVDCDFVLKPYQRASVPQPTEQLELDLGLRRASPEPGVTLPAFRPRRSGGPARKDKRAITREKAGRIAAKFLSLTTWFVGARMREVIAWHETARVFIYNAPPGIEENWVAYLKFPNEWGVLRSSRIIVVSRTTGRVLYAGDASDEG